MSTITARPASEKQFAFIKRLVAERDITAIAERVENDRAWAQAGQFSTADASALIDLLLDQPRAAAPASAPAPVEVPEGMHQTIVEAYGPEPTIFKVQRAVNGSGRLYAKRLSVVDEQGTVVFNHEPGALRYLNESTKMSIEDAKAFGVLYGTCCVCGRTLTDETSIAEGIGPICAKKF